MTALPMDRVIAYELQVHGAHGMAAHEYPAMLEMVVSGALRPDRLVGSVITLDGAVDALMSMDRNTGGGMTVITP